MSIKIPEYLGSKSNPIVTASVATDGCINNSCQLSCEVGNSGCNACQSASCQVACQWSCQTICESCENCQGAACQTCENCQGAACQTCENCEGLCLHSGQISCCENNCESGGCMSQCESCQDSCELYGQGCDDACEGTCQTTCQSGCQEEGEGCSMGQCGTSQSGCDSCESECQGCQGVACQSCEGCETACEGQSQRPPDWHWSSVFVGGTSMIISEGKAVLMSATEWNNFTTKINTFLVYKGQSTITFTAAVAGQLVTVSQMNVARSAINSMSPSTAVPDEITVGEVVSAAFVNGLAESLNSIS